MIRLSISARQALAKLTLPVLIAAAFGVMLLGKADALLAERARMALADTLAPLFAVASEPLARVRDAVVLKTIGATRSQIRGAWLVEFGLLGLVAGVLAAAAGSAASWAVVRFVMRAEWVFLPVTLALTVLGCVLLTLALGYVGTALALRARPAPLLRNE